MRLLSDDSFGIMTVWAEARGETFAGQQAVAEVIQRRTTLRYFSNGTVWSTVTRPWQFSCWRTSDPNFPILLVLDDIDPAVKSCTMAWAAAKVGPAIVPDAVLYLNLAAVPVSPPWVAKSRFVAKVDHHSFYAVA